MELAEKIRKNIEQSHFESDKLSIPITVSIGVAAYQGEQVLRQLVQRADEALYEAKEGGRNCVKASAEL
ncbi:MAG TPA: diguanylate cyclase [Cycloclasticus sp.]|jgi:diguanylate cyclase (GGDEF)-like protein|nr:diguanylate cyclase [Cycloclasticus sp.]